MKIMIINPNSDIEMTKAIEKTVKNYAKGEFEVICKPTMGGPKFIARYEDHIMSATGMIKLVKENEEKVDGFIIACHSYPNLDLIKEITRKPVVGIAEASMKIASMLGHKFSVISPIEHSIPNKEALVRKYHLQDMLASVRAPKSKDNEWSEEESLTKAAELAVKEDKAEVIVLGCAGMTGLDRIIQKNLSVPVLDGVTCALIILTGLIKYGVSTSKVRRYNPEF